MVSFIAESIFCVFLPEHSDTSHVVDFSKRTCTDCHYFEEHLLPCVHLFAVWINHASSEIALYGAEKEQRIDDVSVYKHLCGEVYWLDTLEASLSDVAVALPISLESVAVPEPDKPLVQKTTSKTAGRPALKRRASNMDFFKTGFIKRSGQTINKENVENSVCPI